MKMVGIIVAMREEREPIVNIMGETKVKEIHGQRFIEGSIQGKKCVLAKTGVGKVNAARTTQMMIDNYDIEYIINLGAGGAINGDLNIGDVIIGDYVVQHDFDITAFGHSKGYISDVGNNVKCDRDLLEKTEKIVENLQERSYDIRRGIIATGDIFCTESWMKDKIYAKFSADVIDMESGAIAQVCYLDNIPFITIKAITDTPNGNNVGTYEQNLRLASKRCANILKEFLKPVKIFID